LHWLGIRRNLFYKLSFSKFASGHKTFLFSERVEWILQGVFNYIKFYTISFTIQIRVCDLNAP
jgi:hypothetical protein